MFRLNVKSDFKKADTYFSSNTTRVEPKTADRIKAPEDLIFKHDKTKFSHEPN